MNIGTIPAYTNNPFGFVINNKYQILNLCGYVCVEGVVCGAWVVRNYSYNSRPVEHIRLRQLQCYLNEMVFMYCREKEQ